MSSQTANELRSVYNEDLIKNAALGYDYPNGNLLHIDLERDQNLDTLDFDLIQEKLKK
jgi:hypothetical protein